ncbi:MAG: FAD-dependent oxidoreductase [Deltaproteobacteria bacterium]|jgi:glycine/D-amino acid oxidase-like deaminating enzyme|nr:FAD-dependent oxidoreductase [Deltaproteobacteria bacterium]
MSAENFRSPSFWFSDLDEPVVPRAPLDGDNQFDVAIVGAGYTGLWTAYYLNRREPGCRIAIVEAEVAGFGASGRNGGWCAYYFSGIDALYSDPSKRAGALALQRAMFDAVDEVGRASAAAGIDCDYAKGGALVAGRTPPDIERLREEYEEMIERGFSEEDFQWLDASGFAERARIDGALGGLYSPHCAAIQPAKLACGLASFLEARGVSIFERSPVRTIAKGLLTTDRGRIRAENVLRCTEGYTCRIPGFKRAIMPLHSMMIATEPLPDSVWKEIGLAGRPTFADRRRSVTYGQRTADGRLTFGTRGNYFYGSGIRDYFDPAAPGFAHTHAALLELFPSLGDVAITHRWGGPIGVTRDWAPFVQFDPRTGVGAVGGYAGNGVAAANLAGQTLVELVLREKTELTSYAWINHASRNWEPEPLRWLGFNAVLTMGERADAAEERGRDAGLYGRIFEKFVAH